jgi:flagellar protein FlgJ
MNIITDATIALKEAGKNADTFKEKRLKEACAGFEAILLKQMLSAARRSTPQSGLIGGGFGENMYRSLYDDHLAEKMAASKGLGFGRLLYDQLATSLNATKK